MNERPVVVAVTVVAVFAMLVGVVIGLLLAFDLDLIRDADTEAPSQPLVGPFTDIEGHWAEPYIEAIRLGGLTAGCSTIPPMYCPDRPLTRAEAAVLLARMLEITAPAER